MLRVIIWMLPVDTMFYYCVKENWKKRVGCRKKTRKTANFLPIYLQPGNVSTKTRTSAVSGRYNRGSNGGKDLYVALFDVALYELSGWLVAN